MKLSLSTGTVLAFLALVFVCHELHEISHTAVARLQCGCWGQRDFNVWAICEACTGNFNTIWATVAGPVLTYLLIWIGFVLMGKNSAPQYQSLGWALVFANKPFARIFTVLMRGGDESVITRSIFGQDTLTTFAWAVEILVVLLLIVPPLVRAWKLMSVRYRTAIFTAFFLLPMLIEFALMHKLGNALLQKGFLSQTGIFGSPVLVNLWTGLWVIILVITFRELRFFFTAEKQRRGGSAGGS